MAVRPKPYQPLVKLVDSQLDATKPDELIWLSASAGTGKTQVLSARVLRLLLNQVRPESILALTFTKAGAAEMADRINERLAKWVMASDSEINADLKALGETPTSDLRNTARTSFARVLDARGGGLRIQTIHSFCQSLLGSFPAEAGLNPGFRLMDVREEASLPRTVLASMADAADADTLERLEELALDRGEGGATKFLNNCASAADDLAQLDGVNLYAMISRALSGLLDIEAAVVDLCTDPLPTKPLLDEFVEQMKQWGTPTGEKRIVIVNEWLTMSPKERSQSTGALLRAWQTGDGKIAALPKNDEFQQLAASLFRWGSVLHEKALLAKHAVRFSRALDVGRQFAILYREAKQAAGLVDYDDLIRRTVRLLHTPGMGEWVRFKLEQGIDHILIDEAQDTSVAQWDIVRALAGEFFAGEGARDDSVVRTLFAVGDFKQAIFGFQGTNPRNFSDARDGFATEALAIDRTLHELSLNRSFRTSSPVLRLVDEVISVVGADTLGVRDAVDPHETAIGEFGAITLLPPIAADSDGDDTGEEDWVSDAQRLLAKRIADQLSLWLGEERLWLNKQGRALEPKDVLILLRSRGDLAQLIVARLHERGIPVAGLDRLALGAPLAVKDLLACARFALQPEDDLNLACLLVSPLIGWTQTQLYDAARQRGDKHLWPHLGEEARAPLLPILGAVDMTSPYQFFELILSGPMQGRQKLLYRLGEEARDPVDALLSATLEFESNHPPSLQAFVDWFDRGEVEIKREAESGGNAVRVMTAHGAKGLQAPLVILADATRNPDSMPKSSLSLTIEPENVSLPVFRPRKEENVGPLRLASDLADLAEREEHWRLLYVALTRAEERLVIGGALTRKDSNGPPQASWYAMVRQAMVNIGAIETEAGLWGGVSLHYEVAGQVEVKQLPLFADDRPARPTWFDKPAPDEVKPLRPLAPSSLGPDNESAPPVSAARSEAARRGRLLHALFERLPAVPALHRAKAADDWLRGAGGVSDSATRTQLANDAINVIEYPEFADIFSPEALTEAPLAGIVESLVISGTVDRLLVSEREVLVVDYKTGARVPRAAELAPPSHLRQMAAYAALLGGIFPEKTIRAALLYTNGPVLLPLADALLAAHKPGLQG